MDKLASAQSQVTNFIALIVNRIHIDVFLNPHKIEFRGHKLSYQSLSLHMMLLTVTNLDKMCDRYRDLNSLSFRLVSPL